MSCAMWLHNKARRWSEVAKQPAMQGRILARQHTPLGTEQGPLFTREAFHNGTFLQAWMLSANCCLFHVSHFTCLFAFACICKFYGCGR